MPTQSVTPAVAPATTTTHHTVTTAAGVFAPGHLGELTQTLPFEMIDDVLARTGRTQKRLRCLPSRVVVYLLLAGALFTDQGYQQVWSRLTSALGRLGPAPSSSALAHARQRIGATPLKALFELVAGPPPAPTRWRGLLVCAIDGTTLFTPDSPQNLARYGKHSGSGYPMLRLVAVVVCGTRTVLGAVFGPCGTGETTYAPRVLGCLRAGMVLLGDRNFAVAGLIGQITDTGAELLVRCKNQRSLPVLGRLGDGSWISTLGGVRVRVVDAHVIMDLEGAGRRAERYRLVTTLLDDRRYPAGEVVALYHQRWEVETVYRELKSTILDKRVLRARAPWGVEQEVYALLTAYQALRFGMCQVNSDTDQ